jgi:hypothetical protein
MCFCDQVALYTAHFLTCFVFTRRWTNDGLMKHVMYVCMYECQTGVAQEEVRATISETWTAQSEF